MRSCRAAASSWRASHLHPQHVGAGQDHPARLHERLQFAPRDPQLTPQHVGQPDAERAVGFDDHPAIPAVPAGPLDGERRRPPPRAVVLQQRDVERTRERQLRIVSGEPLEQLAIQGLRAPAARHRAVPYGTARRTAVDEPHVQPLLLRVHAELACRGERRLSTAGATGTQGRRRAGRGHAPSYRFHGGKHLPLRFGHMRKGRCAQAAPRRYSAFS